MNIRHLQNQSSTQSRLAKIRRISYIASNVTSRRYWPTSELELSLQISFSNRAVLMKKQRELKKYLDSQRQAGVCIRVISCSFVDPFERIKRTIHEISRKNTKRYSGMFNAGVICEARVTCLTLLNGDNRMPRGKSVLLSTVTIGDHSNSHASTHSAPKGDSRLHNPIS